MLRLRGCGAGVETKRRPSARGGPWAPLGKSEASTDEWTFSLCRGKVNARNIFCEYFVK